MSITEDHPLLRGLPPELVFVDDQYDHAACVSRQLETASELQIQVSCYHYRAEVLQDDDQDDDDSDETRMLQMQMEAFVDTGTVMTNKEARRALRT